MTTASTSPMQATNHHLLALRACLEALDGQTALVAEWGGRLAQVLRSGGRLLVAGNGGSAAQAQHLTAELVGRYCADRPGFSAICLTAETSSLTAIANDYGFEEIFARQVRAHGRPGDVLLCLSTSGSSPNLIAAAVAGQAAGLTVWSLTGSAPNRLIERSHDSIGVVASTTATVQEAHLVLVHLLCEAFDAAIEAGPGWPR